MAMIVSRDTYHYLPEGYTHTFLIRDPLRMMYSYRKLLYTMVKSAGLLSSELADNEQAYDLERDDRFFTQCPGYFVKEQYDLWVYVKETFNPNPLVIDTEDLLRKPKETLFAYCSVVGLPYSDNLLKWDGSMDVVKKID